MPHTGHRVRVRMTLQPFAGRVVRALVPFALLAACGAERHVAQPPTAALSSASAATPASSAFKQREVRRASGAIRSLHVFTGRDDRVVTPAAAETTATDYLAAHRADLGLSAAAHLRLRSSATIDHDVVLSSAQVYDYVVEGADAPCEKWQLQLDVRRAPEPLVTRVETICANDPDLFAEERIVQQVLGGTLEPTSNLSGAHPEWRILRLRGRTMQGSYSEEQSAKAANDLLRAFGAKPEAYERIPLPAGKIERRLRDGALGPCPGHRLELDMSPYRWAVTLACDGQPRGATCGTDRGPCMGGLTCKLTAQDFHDSRGTCVAR